MKKLERSCVYIDGFNLYYGLKSEEWARYYWLDLEKLSQAFVSPSTENLERVKYFTSRVAGESRDRQKIYISALESCCPKLEIYYGHFLTKQRQCPKCGHRHDVYEEKKTDVNIACQMLIDAVNQTYDRIYIVSGDSDLVPAVEAIKKIGSRPQIIIAKLPKRKSKNLCEVADNSFYINKTNLRVSQMPETVKGKKGADLTRPDTWV